MSSIFDNRNPNSELSMNMMTQPLTSASPENSEETVNPIPNWLEFPEDIWFIILSKLQTIFIIENAQKVCMLFRKLCKQPAMFKTIDMSLPGDPRNLPYDVNKMTRFAVDRSAGGLVDINLEKVCDDETLMYIVDSSKNLKRLVLQNHIDVSDITLVKAVGKLSMLEELEIIICPLYKWTVDAIGLVCPSLKSFTLNDIRSKNNEYLAKCADEDCEAIARNMSQLCHLQLIGNKMTNEGLKAILDGCPHLESLDLRACNQISLSEDLAKRCKAIKHVRYPNEPTKDYGWRACYGGEEEDDEDEDSIDDGCEQYFLW